MAEHEPKEPPMADGGWETLRVVEQEGAERLPHIEGQSFVEGTSNPGEMEQIEAILADIELIPAHDEDKETKEDTPSKETQQVEYDGGTYSVTEVPKEDIFPALGYASSDGHIQIREDLPDPVRQAVLAHEVGHLRPRNKLVEFVFGEKRGPWLRTETEAYLYGFRKEPVNSIKAVGWVLTNKEQRQGLVKASFGRQ